MHDATTKSIEMGFKGSKTISHFGRAKPVIVLRALRAFVVKSNGQKFFRLTVLGVAKRDSGGLKKCIGIIHMYDFATPKKMGEPGFHP
jgi:hypothetical protein